MGDLELFEYVSNPLDTVEDLLSSQDWVFTRAHDEELSVTVNGKQGAYKMTFLWQEEFSAMQFFCEYDFSLPEERRALTERVLRKVNEELWLGHFDVPTRTHVPCFRHTSLFRGWTQSSGAEHIEDLLDIALAEGERFYSVFSMIAHKAAMNESLLDFMLSESAGEA